AAILVLVVASICLLSSCKRPQSSLLAITHVSVIEMTGAPAAPEETVLIDKEKIIAVGPSNLVSIPSGAKILNAAGKFLIPGFAEMTVTFPGAGEPDGSRKFMLPFSSRMESQPFATWAVISIRSFLFAKKSKKGSGSGLALFLPGLISMAILR